MPISTQLVQKYGNKHAEKVDGFICAIGSGGTIAGVAKYLKKKIQKYKLGYLILMDQHFIIISKSMK